MSLASKIIQSLQKYAEYLPAREPGIHRRLIPSEIAGFTRLEKVAGLALVFRIVDNR
jgi:hypothetical protein